MKARKSQLRWLFALAAAALAFYLLPETSAWKQVSYWQQWTSPGDLSRAHASLEQNCAACHTSVQGVDETKCIVCHASNLSILQRQPTAFHANIGTCKECHPEHRGFGQRPTFMDHEALSQIGLGALGGEADGGRAALHDSLAAWVDSGSDTFGEGVLVSRLEAVLDCAACHANEDQHFGLFGADCAQCHASDRWTIPVFRHPSPQSRDCAQCHQAPPSHYMGHFKMISAKIARKPRATVDQCFECHRTTAWTDIPGVGHYKHH